MGERRRSARQKSFLRGCIYFNKRRNSLDCLIRDISSEGARIIFSEAVNVPDLVELYIPQKEQTVRARVQWRHGDEIGLAFPDYLRAADGTSAGELALRVTQLESEIASLRRVLKRLQSEMQAGDDVDAA
jgi:hypothetical protein